MLLTYLSLVLTTLLWGGTFISGRMLASGVDPALSAFLRFVIGSLAMIITTLVVEGRMQRPPAKLILPLCCLGATGVFAYNVCFFNGLHHISASRASLFIACTPLVITLLAALFLKEPLTRIKTTGILVSLTGAIFVISNGHPAALLQGGFGIGEASLIGCVLSWAAYTLIGRPVLRTLSPLTTVCYSSVIGTLLLAIPVFYRSAFVSLPALHMQDWGNLIYLGVFGTAVGFSLYYRAIRMIGASRAAVFINLVPLFALMLAWTLLGETLKPTVLVGGLLVLTGIALTNYKPKQVLK